MKCLSVLAGCQNFGQLNTACNLIHNYGKMYGCNGKWMHLQKKSWALWREHVDMVEYQERLKTVNEQEVSMHPEGESV